MRVRAAGGDEVQIVDDVVFRHGRRRVLRSGRRAHEQFGQPLLGFLPREYVIGRVVVRWWPLSEWRLA
jgi:hypothetical protein